MLEVRPTDSPVLAALSPCEALCSVLSGISAPESPSSPAAGHGSHAGDGETEALPLAQQLRSGGTLPGTEVRAPHPSRPVSRMKWVRK